MKEILSHAGDMSQKLRRHHAFGVHDRKGRELGAQVVTMLLTMLPGPYKGAAGDSGSTVLAPGVYYCWQGCATRAGDPFGASQPRHFCKTELQRDTEIAEYLRGAKVRAEKRAALETNRSTNHA